MNINIIDEDKSFYLNVSILDFTDNKYEFVYDLQDGDSYTESEGFYHTINPINPLELPILILTSILENYYGERKG